jgi:hypothetical protein
MGRKWKFRKIIKLVKNIFSDQNEIFLISTGKWYASNDVMYAENKQSCKLYSFYRVLICWHRFHCSKLKIKYELSYQYNTRLKYIDKFDQLLIIHQWRSTVDNTVRSLTHFTIFIWYYVIEHFPSFIKSSLNNWCPMKMFIVRDTDNNSSDYIT